MNFTFNIGELVAIIGGALAVGAAFEKLRRLDRSAASNGARIGLVEGRVNGVETSLLKLQAVEAERERVRIHTAAHGIPVHRE